MKLVVGLGNPGRKYNGTRHNVGFEVIAHLAKRYGMGLPKSKFNAELDEVLIANQKTILVSPLTFMNLSGQAVRAVMDFYKSDIADLLVICDDLNLDVGRIRLKPSGSAGGQNGLKDIINRMGSQKFSRLRLGIGKPPPEWNVSNYVLGKFDEPDRVQIDEGVRRCVQAVEVWVEHGIQTAMNKFNADPNATPKKRNKKKSESGESNDDSNQDNLKADSDKENDRG